MRLSKLSLWGLLLLSSVGSYASVPRTQPNWYAPKGYFTSLATKLSTSKRSGHVISIIQLGDSHIQAGHTTAPLWQKVQSTYGNAGRGWVGC